MLQLAVEEAVAGLYALAGKQQCSIGELEPVDDDILKTTGPYMWSQVVFKSLSRAVNRTVTIEELSGLEEPRLYGDILVFPIDGFSPGIGHSGSGKHPELTLIRHGFKGTWRGLPSD